MNRRALLALLVMALARPVARAQPARRMPRIGVLTLLSLESDPRMPSFVAGMRELGYVEGRTIGIEWRSADGREERLARYAAELVRLKVDLIFAVQPQAVDAARRATATIPIVFAVGQDPVGMGFAQILSRPGGNITGHSSMASDIAIKQLELLRAAIPNCSRIVVILNPTNPGGSTAIRTAMESAGRKLGVAMVFYDARTAGEVQRAFDAAAEQRADAVFVGPDAFFIQVREAIAEIALRHRLPTLFVQREHVAAGGTMSYGPNLSAQYRRAAYYIDRILKGAVPGELPIEQPSKFDLVFNLKSARLLGLGIPESLLVRADEVIQ